MLNKISNKLNKDLKLWQRLLVLLGSGVLTGLMIAFPTVGFLEWITIVPAAIILLHRR